MQSANCSLVITSGGAKRIILPCVGFANKPWSLRRKHIFQAVLLSSVSLIKIALSKPLPRTKFTILLFSWRYCWHCRLNL